MKKGYYIVGVVLLGVGAYLLYTKIKNGNSGFITGNGDSLAETEEGGHLNPPMEAQPTIPPLATLPIV